MKLNKQEISKTRWEYEAIFDEAEVAEAKARILEKLAPNVKVDGFRKGKAPLVMVENRVNQMELWQDVMESLVNDLMFEQIRKDSLAIYNPEVVPDDGKIKNAQPTVKIAFDVVPNVELTDYKKLKVKFAEPKVEAKDVDELIDTILTEKANPVEAKREIKDGDIAVIDFVGKKDGKPFKNGTAKNYQLKIGSHQFIEGFEEGIVGHLKGDKFELTLKFPENYFEVELAGKPVVFEVELKKVLELKKPELTNELTKKLWGKDLAEFKAEVEKSLTAQKTAEAKQKLLGEILKELRKKAKLQIPEKIKEGQIASSKAALENHLKNQGLTLEGVAKMSNLTPEEMDKKQAEEAVEILENELVIEQLAKDLAIEIPDEDIKMYHEMAHGGYDHKPEKLRKGSSEWGQISHRLSQEQVARTILEFFVK
ncbi:MAG: trigger factor [Candidatus Nomurabacteria bacterium]|jgi:trigger factor|nr:trigger factor [Candidatus Nomurabacteria bacterium]